MNVHPVLFFRSENLHKLRIRKEKCFRKIIVVRVEAQTRHHSPFFSLDFNSWYDNKAQTRFNFAGFLLQNSSKCPSKTLFREFSNVFLYLNRCLAFY
jgi:hypothetical protein